MDVELFEVPNEAACVFIVIDEQGNTANCVEVNGEDMEVEE